jgi:hypothetical protein
MMTLPAVIPSDPPAHCPQLIRLFVSGDAETRLRAECATLIDEGFVPAIAWYETRFDPVLYRWPVRGMNVLIYGDLPRQKLRCLLAALKRDGALIAAGLDTDGKLHIVSNRVQKAAA